MSFDNRKLLSKIVEVYGTQYNFSIALGLSERTVSLKLNGLRSWKSSEMEKIVELLDIPTKEIYEYFFKH